MAEQAPLEDRPEGCAHDAVACLNPYEFIRKYRCADCDEVMMCACDEAFGRRFLAHQLSQGTELKSQRRVPVTAGFRPQICAECRGLPLQATPVDAIHGRTSKIKRYYWRELFFMETARVGDWDDAHPAADTETRAAAHAAIAEAVLTEIKALHAEAPKYVISEPSQAEILQRYAVDVVPLNAPYVETPKKGAVIQRGDDAISPEAFVAEHYAAQGWSVLPLESAPFHALFGVFMWVLIQDSFDPQVRLAGFGERSAFEAGKDPAQIWTHLPDDFGTEGYGERRRAAIARHFELLEGGRDELLWLFDYWRSYSTNLRQYLWAHRDADVDRARRLVEILPPDLIRRILLYLVEDYWGRFVGWPDLLLFRDEALLLLEVKSSGDKLSQEQKRWIADNHDRLKLPFKVVKLHRATSRAS